MARVIQGFGTAFLVHTSGWEWWRSPDPLVGFVSVYVGSYKLLYRQSNQ